MTIVTAGAVLEAASVLFGVGVDELTSAGKRRPLTDYRAVTMAVMRQLTGASLSTIGRTFERDPSTIKAALRRVAERPTLSSWSLLLVERVLFHQEGDLAALRAELEELRARLDRLDTPDRVAVGW